MSDSEHSGMEQDDEFDKELQAAFQSGLLRKDQLNIVVRSGISAHLPQRRKINRAVELRQKAQEFVKSLPWVETLEVDSPCELTPEIVKDDFKRELAFYNQAVHSVKLAVPRLRKLGVPLFRPKDYYAEMAKSDAHMQKIRKRLLDVQESKEKAETIKRLREEKRFAAKVKKAVEAKKLDEKKKLAVAVAKHKKGMKGQLEEMLSNARKMQLDEDEDDNRTMQRGGSNSEMRNAQRNMSRDARNKKFGYGGQKKRMKHNDKRSHDEVFAKPKGAKSFANKRRR